MESARAVNLHMAKLAEKAERYDEMVAFMEKVVAEGGELNEEERFVLLSAFKHTTTALRGSWRVVSSLENSVEIRAEAIKDYKAKIESELSAACDRCLALLDSACIPCTSTAGEMVYYLKLKGDYNRYLAEFRTGTDRHRATGDALSAYTESEEIATSELPPSDIDRLDLHLSFAVFHYHILNKSEVACNMAKKAYDEAMGEESNPEAQEFKILEMLKQNLTSWTSAEQDEYGKQSLPRSS